MDHFRQIPQVGRAWDDFPESCTTPAWLAAGTERVRLGTLVTGVTYRLLDLPGTAAYPRPPQEHVPIVLGGGGERRTLRLAARYADVDALVEHLRPRGSDPARFAAAVHAGTVDDHVGHFRELADAGVAEVAVRLPGLTDPAPLARIAPVIAAFR